MLRVRPAQFTTTKVLGSGASSRMRYTSSAPGRLCENGSVKLWNSSGVRLSTTTMSSPRATRSCSSSTSIHGVCFSCSMTSPKALLGTLVPENSSRPSRSQPSVPPASTEMSVQPRRVSLAAA